MVDETDRLLREAYQSWLPTVLQLAYSSNQTFEDDNICPTFGSLKTIRSLSVLISFLFCYLNYALIYHLTYVLIQEIQRNIQGTVNLLHRNKYIMVNFLIFMSVVSREGLKVSLIQGS